MRDEIADGGNDRTLIKTQDYLEVFARFKQKENIEAVERMLLQKDELELFERSQLGIYSTR
jgi:DNA-directed RNA polymerase II subunit RPB4